MKPELLDWIMIFLFIIVLLLALVLGQNFLAWSINARIAVAGGLFLTFATWIVYRNVTRQQ